MSTCSVAALLAPHSNSPDLCSMLALNLNKHPIRTNKSARYLQQVVFFFLGFIRHYLSVNLFVLYICIKFSPVFLPVSPDSFRRVLWPVFLWFLRMCLDMLLVLKWLKRCSNIGQFYSNSLICLPCAVLAERSRHTLWSALRSSLTFHYLPRRFVFRYVRRSCETFLVTWFLFSLCRLRVFADKVRT